MAFDYNEGELVDQDTGRKYWMPFDQLEGRSASEPGMDPNQAPLPVNLVNPFGAPADDSIPAGPHASFELEPERGQVQRPDTQLPPIKVPPVAGVTTGIPQGPKLSAAQQRHAGILQNPTEFNASGDYAKSREDVAALAGGQAATAEASVLAQQQAEREQLEGLAKKASIQSQMELEHADKYANRVREIDRNSESRLAEHKRRQDELDKRVVDPNRAFKNTSTFGRVMWAMSFLSASQTKNALGSLGMVMNMVDNMVQQDIAAQQSDIKNKQFGVENSYKIAAEQDKLDARSLDRMSHEFLTRYKAVEKGIDAQIALRGRPAAEAAGLLKAKAAIQEKVLATNMTLQGQVQAENMEAKKEAHAAYMARLNHGYKLAEDEFKAGLDAKKFDREHTQYLPTGTDLGLQMTKKGSTEAIKDGKIKLRTGLNADQARKAGDIIQLGNKEATMLNEVKNRVAKMSTSDLIRGGDPEFKQLLFEFMQPFMRKEGGTALTENEQRTLMLSKLGFATMGTGLMNSAGEAIKTVGSFREGAQKAIETRLRNLPKDLKNDLNPYIDPDFAQQHDIQFNPQSTHEKTPDKDQKTQNEFLLGHGGTAERKTVDVLAEGSTSTGNINKHAITTGNPYSISPEAMKLYSEAKQLNRDTAGGLPDLPGNEEKLVTEAIEHFKNRSPRQIEQAAEQAVKGKTKLSDQAKFEILAEARLAAVAATPREEAAVEEMYRSYIETTENAVHLPTKMNTRTLMKPVPGSPGERAFAAYQKTKEAREVRTKYAVQED